MAGIDRESCSPPFCPVRPCRPPRRHVLRESPHLRRTGVHDEESSVAILPDVRTDTTNPLEPLGPDEIRRTAAVLREQKSIGPRVRFVTIALHEPPKQEVLEYERNGGSPPERAAFAVLYDRDSQTTIEAVVSLDAGVVSSWSTRDDVQPSIMLEEFFATEELTRSDPRWQEAMRKRGVTDFSL